MDSYIGTDVLNIDMIDRPEPSCCADINNHAKFPQIHKTIKIS